MIWKWVVAGGWKIVGVLGFVLSVFGYLKLRDKAAEKRGARKATDEMDRQGREAEDAMRTTEKPRDADDVDRDLRSGNF